MTVHFVIDTSVVMSWCFRDQTSAYADSVLDRLSSATAVAPSIWPLEVANVLLVAERRKRLSAADSLRFATLLSGLPILVEHETQEQVLKDILSLARAHGLSSYDASYLALAMRKGAPLATLDKKLMAVSTQLKVDIF
jgi:predicted nucleic acid-binding protein